MTTAVTLFAGPGTVNCGAAPYHNGTIQFRFVIDGTIRTLSNTNSPAQESYKGLLFVPSLEAEDGNCNNNLTAPYIPNNITRRNDIPLFDHDIIGLAPWISPDCALAFLAASRRADARALIFYQPDSQDSAKPPPPGDSVWDLGGNDQWKKDNDYPVYAIPGPSGTNLMHQLSQYSGHDSDDNLNATDSSMNETQRLASCTRLYALFDLEPDDSAAVPGIWVFVLAILGALVLMVIVAYLGLQHVQKKRRESLQRRVVAGEVDLEYLGIKRLVVPQHILSELPVYVYPINDVEEERVKKKLSSPKDEDHESEEGDIHQESSTSQSVPEKDDDTKGTKSTNLPPSHSQSFITIEDEDESISAILDEIMPKLQPPPRALNSDGSSSHQLTFSQRTCAICLDDFVPGTSLVRELPCTHIFHPECVDTFLMRDGSTCPVCKHNVLPPSFITDQVNNLMVRREQRIRRLQRLSQQEEHRQYVGRRVRGQHRSPIHESEMPELPLPFPSSGRIWARIRTRLLRQNSSREESHQWTPREGEEETSAYDTQEPNSITSEVANYDPTRREMMQRRAMVLLGTPVANASATSSTSSSER